MLFYYTVCLAGMIYLTSVLKGFEFQLLSSTLSRSIRDILIILYLPNFVFAAILVLRVIGFDVKKFDFTSSKESLGIEQNDNEEVELNFTFNINKVRKSVRRFFRELFYYLKENKFILLCIFVAGIIYLGFYVYKNSHADYDQFYSMKNIFIYNNLNISIDDAILTNLDYNGNVIDEKYYYYVLKTNVENNSGSTQTIDFNKFKLKINEYSYNVSIGLSNKFQDFAPIINNSTFAPKAKRTFSLVYQIPIKQIDRNAEINLYLGSVYDKGEYLAKKINVNLKAKKVDAIDIVGNYMLNDEIDFSQSLLGNTKLLFNNYLITKTYIYSYSSCNKNNTCSDYNNILLPPLKDNRHDNTLIILKSQVIIDDNVEFFKNYSSITSFAEYFIKIQYKVGDKIYTDNFINVTPKENVDFIAFEGPKEIGAASVIQAIITVRDKQYIVNLKA